MIPAIILPKNNLTNSPRLPTISDSSINSQSHLQRKPSSIIDNRNYEIQSNEFSSIHQTQLFPEIISESKELQLGLEDLDIDPINKNEQFVIDQNDEIELRTVQYTEKQDDEANSSHQIFKNSRLGSQELNLYSQSQIWADVFYAKKTIMHLLQERNDVCEFYHLNSKALHKNAKKSSNSSSMAHQKLTKLISDWELSQYIRQILQQSPSYQDYDEFSFAVIPEHHSILEKYYVFLGTDQKYVPLCKACNISIYFAVTVQTPKPSAKTLISQGQKHLKGKLICSNLKCRKKLLGEFTLSHNELPSNKNAASRVNGEETQRKKGKTTKIDKTVTILDKYSDQHGQNHSERHQLSEVEKLRIQKAVKKIAY